MTKKKKARKGYTGGTKPSVKGPTGSREESLFAAFGLYRSGDYDAALVPQNIGRGLSRPYVFWHSSQPNAVPGYTAADAALEALRRAVTPDEVSEAALSFQAVLYEDPPAIFIATPRQARAVHRRFDVTTTAGQDLMDTVWRWQPAEDFAAQ